MFGRRLSFLEALLEGSRRDLLRRQRDEERQRDHEADCEDEDDGWDEWRRLTTDHGGEG